MFNTNNVNVNAEDSLAGYPKAFDEMLGQYQTSFKSYVATLSIDFASTVANMQKQMIGLDNSSKNLIRGMGGVADFTGEGAKRAEEFRRRISDAQKASVNMGGTLKDVQDAVTGLAEGMGRMVNPTSDVLKNIIATSKAFGLTTAESAKMVTEFVKFGGTQTEALKTMKGIADEARKTGINTAAYMKAVQGGLKMANGFGFKNGIEGLKSMAKQAAMLRTSIESLGAKGLQSKILDPEGAIEAAAGFQMLGGAVGKLADPFQLMHMAQTDMAGLQEELVKSTKSSFAFNKETGKFEASTQDLYRLRQQAELTGANFDEMLEAGKEASKLDFLSNAVDLSSLNEAQQGLISSLAEIDKNGKVTVDIPGYDEIDKNTGEIKDLATLMKEQGFKDALEKYQSDEKKTAEQIALDQMNLSEKQLASVKRIETAVVLSMSENQQEDFFNKINESNKSMEKTFKEGTDDLKGVSGKVAIAETKLEASAAAAGSEVIGGGTAALKQELEDYFNTINVPDALIPSTGSRPMVLSKGTLYKGLVDDDVAMGTNLSDAFSKSGKLNDMLSSIGSTQNAGGNTSVNGKIDININLTGAISGDKNADVEKMFSDPRVQKQIMDTVLYKLDSYKRQQGVLS
jgi:hypothetical protein